MEGRLKQLNALCLVKSLNEFFLRNLKNEKYDDTMPYRHLSEASALAKDELHTLFIKISNLGLAVARQPARVDTAHLILLKLNYALKEHPDLLDSQKSVALQDIARFFLNIGEQFHFESIMESIHCIDAEPGFMPIVDTKSVLSDSYVKTSIRAKEALSKIWQKKYGPTGIPLNCYVSPPQRPLHKPHLMLAWSLIKESSSDSPGSNILEQQNLHMAASLGVVDLLNKFILDGADVDARDLFKRTPLMMAVVAGHEPCCRLLIEKKCDVSLRDLKQRTILELAADTGNTEIVRILIQAKANVNPQLIEGNSTPLQVAICSKNFNQELIILLLDHGSKVFEERLHDGRTAIQLAKERQQHELARTMEHDYAWTQPIYKHPTLNLGT